MSFLLKSLLTVLLLHALGISAQSASLTDSRLGITALSLAPIGTHPTSGVDFSSTNLKVFRNLMLHGSEFSIEWGLKTDGGAEYSEFGVEYTSSYHPDFDVDGYPVGLLNESYFGRDKIITVASYIGGGGANLPGGDFLCLFDGDGEVSLAGDAQPFNASFGLSTSSGRLPFVVVPSAGMSVRIVRSDPVNYVRNIRIVPLSDDDSMSTNNDTSFRNEFLERLAPFNTLIFHGWLGVDDNDYNGWNLAGRSWQERATSTQHTQRGLGFSSGRLGFGVALEYIVELCNILEADPWLTLPDVESSEDEFATAVAAFFVDNLLPSRRILVQHRWTKSFGNFDRQREQSVLLWDIWKDAVVSKDSTTVVANRLVYVVAGDYYSHTADEWPLWFDPDGNSTVILTTPTMSLAGDQPSNDFASWEGAFHYSSASDATLIDAIRNAELYAEQQMVPLLGYLDSIRQNYNSSLQHSVSAVATFDHGLRGMGYGWRWSLSNAKSCRLAFQERLGFLESYDTTFSKWTSADPNMSSYYEQAQFNCESAVASTSVNLVASNLSDPVNCAQMCNSVNSSECGGFYLPLQPQEGGAGGSCVFLADPHTNIASHQQEGGWGAPETGVGSCFLRPEWFLNMIVQGGSEDLASDADMQQYYDETSSCTSWITDGLRHVSLDKSDPAYGALVDPGGDIQWGIGTLEQHWSDLVQMDELEANLEARLVALAELRHVGYELTLDLLLRWKRLPGTGGVAASLFDIGPIHVCPTGGKMCGQTGLLRPEAANASEVAEPLNSSELGGVFVQSDRNAWHEAVQYYGDVDGIDWNTSLWTAFSTFASSPTLVLLDDSPVGVTSASVVPEIVYHCDAVPCVRTQGICLNGTCRCFQGFQGAGCAVRSVPTCPSSSNNSRLGVGISGLSYYSPQLALTDVYKTMSDWVEEYQSGDTEWDENFPVDLGPHGYPLRLNPNELVQSLVMRDLEQAGIIDGIFVVRWDGDGVLNCEGLDVETGGVFRGTGFMTCNVTFSSEMNNGLLVTILYTNPLDPVRNVRAFLPGFDEGEWAVENVSTVNSTDKGGRPRAHGVTSTDQILHGPLPSLPFHPHFLQFLEPFDYLRFMDWMHANEAVSGDWDMRPDFRDRIFTTGGGVPLEYIVLLSNLLGKNMWINTPVEADGEYYRNLALLLAADVRSDLEIVVEVGNELWHTGFYGGDFANLMATKLGMASRHCWAVEATRNASLTMRTVFNELRASDPSLSLPRLTFFVSTQLVNLDVTRHILKDCDFGPMPSSKHEIGIPGGIDALGPAVYFGDEASDNTDSIDQVLENMANLVSPTIVELGQHATMIRNSSNGTLRVMAYECGPGGLGDGSSSDLFIQAHRHATMKNITENYYDEVLGVVDVALHFGTIGQYSQYGSWSLMESSTQNPRSAPKYEAVMQILRNRTSRFCPLLQSIDMCAPGSDHNCSGGHGWCLQDGSEQCLCYTGFAGSTCSEVDFIDSFDCGYECSFDRGTCRVTRVEDEFYRFFECDCSAGYSGRTCARTQCKNSCHWNGECIDADICSCYPGYAGEFCEIDCGCGGHGQCNQSIISDSTAVQQVSCLCDEGWQWDDDSRQCVWACDCGLDSKSTVCAGPGICACQSNCHNSGTCVNGRCQCWAGFYGDECEMFDEARKPNHLSPIGMNVGGVGYGHESVFVDVMKHSGDLVSIYADDMAVEADDQYTWGNGQPIWEFNGSLSSWPSPANITTVPGRGYPFRLDSEYQNIIALTLRDLCFHGTNGDYVVLYDGNGTLDFGMDATITSRRKGRVDINVQLTCDPSCWFDKADWEPYCTDNGLSIQWTALDENDPIRNIRILLPHFESTYMQQPFHPLFLRDTQRYQTLRFMDFHETNSWPVNATPSWDYRTKPIDRTQSNHGSGGAALEYSILLSNTLGANAWYCVPHAADDGYVEAMAEFVLTGLDQRHDTQVFVEYSNEVWNSFFPAGQYATVQGAKLAAHGGCLLYGELCNRARWNAQRTQEISRIWRSVAARLYDAGMLQANWAGEGRIKVVLGAWTLMADEWAQEMLEWNNTADWVDFIGVTGYLSSDVDDSWAIFSADEVIDALWTSASALANATSDSLTKVSSLLKESYQFDDGHFVDLITYEAGPGLVEPGVIEGGAANGHITEVLIEAARSDAMADLYTFYLDTFAQKYGLANSSTPFMAFASTGPYSKYGTWGHQEYSGQWPPAPKWRAVQDFISKSQSLDQASDDTLCVNDQGRFESNSAPNVASYALHQFVGAPAVMVPALGSVWITGEPTNVQWDVSGANPNDRVNIYLWSGPSCSTAKYAGTRIATIGAYVPQTGFYQYTPPLSLPAGASYMIEIEGTDGRNFSNFFSVVSPRQMTFSDWSSCSVGCGQATGVQNRTAECTDRTHRSTWSRYEPLFDASTGQSSDCTGSLHIADEFYSYNQWLDRSDYGWTDGFYAGWWLFQPNFTLIDCEYQEGTSCRQYRTHRVDDETVEALQRSHDGVLYANFYPVLDCVAHSAISNFDDNSKELVHPPLFATNWSECDVSNTEAEALLSQECTAVIPSCNQSWYWDVGEFGGCSQDCGTSPGIRTRSIVCREVDLDSVNVEDWQIVSNEQCLANLGAPLSATEECNDIPCIDYSVSVSEYGSCTFSCDLGYVQSRSVHCVSSEGVVSASSLCGSSIESVESTKACSASSISTSWSWGTSDWSDCSVSCGGGTRTREVACTSCASGAAPAAVNGSSPCELDSFLNADRPSTQEACNTFDCNAGVGWFVSEWGACETTLGGDCSSALQTREVSCFDYADETVVEDALCLKSNSSQAPSTTRKCDLVGCPACLESDGNETLPCSGNGDCQLDGCSCRAGTAGAFCQVNSSICATGVQNSDGHCCFSGVSDAQGRCCEDVLSATASEYSLDFDGNCCSGAVDACGVCSGDGIAIAKDGTCCNGILSPDGTCCESQRFDDCGMCDGDGSSCAVQAEIVIEGAAIDSSCSGSLFSGECAAMVDQLSEAACANLTSSFSRSNCSMLSVAAAPSGNADGRRLDVTSVAILIDIVAFGFGTTTSPDVTAICEQESSCVVALQTYHAGFCGDGVCQGGEACYDHASSDCCIADCGLVLQRCAACNTAHGTCHIATGECQCFTGYSGESCNACAPGWDFDSRGERCVSQWNVPSNASTITTSTTTVSSATTTTNVPTASELSPEVVLGIAVAAAALVVVAVVVAVVVVCQRKNRSGSVKVCAIVCTQNTNQLFVVGSSWQC